MGLTSDSRHVKDARGDPQKSSDPAPPAHRWERSLIIFNGLLVIIGALQVWTYVASERAFVTVESLSAEMTINEPIVAHFKVRNSGRTTAFIIDAVANLKIAEILEEAPRYKRWERVSITGPLVAEGSLPVTLKTRAENGAFIIWDEATASKINTGIVNFYAYGFISYQTQFRFFRTLFSHIFPHSTGFCYVYIPDDKNWQYCREQAYIYGD